MEKIRVFLVVGCLLWLAVACGSGNASSFNSGNANQPTQTTKIVGSQTVPSQPSSVTQTTTPAEEAALVEARADANNRGMSLDFQSSVTASGGDRQVTVLVTANQPECSAGCPRQVSKSFQVFKSNTTGQWVADPNTEPWLETRESEDTKNAAQKKLLDSCQMVVGNKNIVLSIDGEANVPFTMTPSLADLSSQLGPRVYPQLQLKLVLTGNPKEYVFDWIGDYQFVTDNPYTDSWDLADHRDNATGLTATVVAYRIYTGFADTGWKPFNSR